MKEPRHCTTGQQVEQAFADGFPVEVTLTFDKNRDEIVLTAPNDRAPQAAIQEVVSIFGCFSRNSGIFLFINLDASFQDYRLIDRLIENLAFMPQASYALMHLSADQKAYVAKHYPHILFEHPTLPETTPSRWRIDLFPLKRRIKSFILTTWEGMRGKLYTVHTRPLFAKNYVFPFDQTVYPPPPYAIVLQGPLLHTHDFTLETVRMYKKLFPTAMIIVSTWEDEQAEDIAALRAEGADVVLSQKPSYSGYGNVNMQLRTTRAGIERAKELGAHYVVKNRTDFRLYAANAIQQCISITKQFPVSERSGQQQRLVIIGDGVMKYQPYMLPDRWMFGGTNDMLEFWSAPELVKETRYGFFIPEIYLPFTFFKRKGWKLEWTIEQWWEILRECVAPIDPYMLDIYWHKYERFREYRNLRSYTGRRQGELFTYADWVSLYMNVEERPIPEYARVHLRHFGPIEQKSTS